MWLFWLWIFDEDKDKLTPASQRKQECGSERTTNGVVFTCIAAHRGSDIIYWKMIEMKLLWSKNVNWSWLENKIARLFIIFSNFTSVNIARQYFRTSSKHQMTGKISIMTPFDNTFGKCPKNISSCFDRLLLQRQTLSTVDKRVGRMSLMMERAR